MSDNVTVETCEKCHQQVLRMMVEPEEKTALFDPMPMQRYRVLEITPSFKVMVATPVHEIHTATCKAINRT